MSHCCKSLIILILFVPFVYGLNPAEEAYRRGFSEWKENRTREARNWWHKYLAYCQMNPASCNPRQKVEIGKLYSELHASLQSPPPTEPEAPPSPSPSPSKKKKSVASKSDPSPRPIPRTDGTSQELAREAVRARENGQLEYALRLYRLAENADPRTVSYDSEINELIKIVE